MTTPRWWRFKDWRGNTLAARNDDVLTQIQEAEAAVQALQQELFETNRGLSALTLALDKRTAALHETQEQSQRINTALRQGMLELEERVWQHTTELGEVKAHLQRELAERRRLEEELRRKDEELRTMSQQLWQAAKLATMGELSASIAHELNNPLATVSLRVESLLAQATEPTPERRALTVIEQEVERMGHLVAHLLQFSRRDQPQISPIDVTEELENTLTLMQHHLRHHRITITRQFIPDVPLVHADRQQLRQVFLNLMTNASDAMPQGGILTLGVAPQSPEPEARAVLLTFTDTGSGIAPEHADRIMEPFFTTKPEGKGTGLGLFICRRIIQEHHGLMEIRSTVGEGTTIRLTLPTTQRRNGLCV